MWPNSNEQHLSGQDFLLAFHCSYLLLGRTGGKNTEFGNIMVGCLFRKSMDVVVFLVVTPCSLIYPYQKFQCYILLLSVRSWKNVIPANASNLPVRSFSVDRSVTRRSCQNRQRSLPVRLQDVIVTFKVSDGSSHDDRHVSVDSFFLANRRKSLVTRLATVVPSTEEGLRFAHQLLPPSSRSVRFRLKVNRSRPNREN
jgi:hypothetical protein